MGTLVFTFLIYISLCSNNVFSNAAIFNVGKSSNVQEADLNQSVVHVQRTEREADLCKTKCGVAAGVKCITDDSGTSAECGCEDEDKVFNPEKKECKADICKTKCGVTDGVICNRDESDDTSAECACKDEDNVFNPETKECNDPCGDDAKCKNGGECKDHGFCSCLQGTSGAFCEIVAACTKMNCGTDAECRFDPSAKKASCTCKNEGMDFDKNDHTCKVNKCRDVCGVALGTDSDVLCAGDPYGEENVSCQCKEKSKEFVAVTKDCKVNKCNEKCGASTEKGMRAECSGDPFGEESVICFCKGEKMQFSPEEKRCKRIKGLSNLAIAAIALTVIVVIVLTVSTVIYRSRRKSKTPRYSIRFQEQTISFENTLYGSTTDHPAFED